MRTHQMDTEDLGRVYLRDAHQLDAALVCKTVLLVGNGIDCILWEAGCD